MVASEFFEKKTDNGIWHLAVVRSDFYLAKDNTPDVVHLLKWNGHVSHFGSPSFYNTNCWEEFQHHFTPIIFPLNEIEFYFINKVKGNTFKSKIIDISTRSTKDGAIQCNPNGPDRIPKYIFIPVECLNVANINFNTQLKIHTSSFFEYSSNTHMLSMNNKDKNHNKNKKRKRVSNTSQLQSSLSKEMCYFCIKVG